VVTDRSPIQAIKTLIRLGLIADAIKVKQIVSVILVWPSTLYF